METVKSLPASGKAYITPLSARIVIEVMKCELIIMTPMQCISCPRSFGLRIMDVSLVTTIVLLKKASLSRRKCSCNSGLSVPK